MEVPGGGGHLQGPPLDLAEYRGGPHPAGRLARVHFQWPSSGRSR